MLIQIPVTPLTLKCIRFTYPESGEVIKVGVRSALFQNLSKITFSDSDERARQSCTKTIKVDVPKKLFSHIETSNIFLLGFLLHSYEIEMMLNTIEYCVFHLKEEATFSIANYFASRKIEEDDFAINTAYKNWQRRQTQKIGKKDVFRITKTHKNVFDCYSLPYRVIIKHLTVLYDTDIFKFQGSRLKDSVLIERRKVILFLAYKLSSITIRELAKEFCFHYPQIHKNIKLTEFTYQNFEDDKLSNMIDIAFSYLKHKVSPLNIEPLHLTL